MKGATNSIPARELHWKKYSYLRNEEHKIYFMCECGKNLFLHFERKHGQKIKNLHDPSQFETVCTQSEKVYLFYLNNKRCKPTENQKKATSKLVASILGVATTLQEFQQACQTELQELSSANHIGNFFQKFNEFYLYSMLKRHQTSKIECLALISSLPYEFNNFMEAQLFCLPEQYQINCQILLLLSRWLNLQKYSDLVLVYNERDKKDSQSVQFTQ